MELRMRFHVRYMYIACRIVLSNCRPHILKWPAGGSANSKRKCTWILLSY